MLEHLRVEVAVEGAANLRTLHFIFGCVDTNDCAFKPVLIKGVDGVDVVVDVMVALEVLGNLVKGFVDGHFYFPFWVFRGSVIAASLYSISRSHDSDRIAEA